MSRPVSQQTEFDARGLFIVGHGRSGTSILQDALNSSPDIYLFSEANFPASATRKNFVEWYNNMHRDFRNPEYKSTYCPEGPNEAANGLDTLGWLSRRFKYVGDKLATRSEKLGYDFEGFLRFAAKHFLRSTYLCTLRNPLHVIISCLGLFEKNSKSRETVDLYAESCLRTIYLQLRILLLFNQTYFIAHERISENTFSTLARLLDIDLGDGWQFYDEGDVHRPLPPAEDWHRLPSVERVCEVHSRLQHEISDETLRPKSLLNCRKLMYELRAELIP